MQGEFPLTWPAGWPRAKFRRRGKFKAVSFEAARDELERELRMLKAGDVVLSTNLELRLDGLPRSTARTPGDTGVACYFKLAGKDRVLACDAWGGVWENCLSIARHINALRAQERWGVGTIEQAFTGYAALPASTAQAKHWSVVLDVEREHATPDSIGKAFRAKAHAAHPDTGGTADAIQELVRARDDALAELRQHEEAPA